MKIGGPNRFLPKGKRQGKKSLSARCEMLLSTAIKYAKAASEPIKSKVAAE